MPTYLHRTYYTRHYTTWVRRVVASLLITLVSVAWIFSDNEYDLWWISFPILILIGLGILFLPVDDLAVNKDNFYHLETSPMLFFNKEHVFDISQMKSINAFRDNDRVSDADKYTTVIEMIFNDGSVKSFKVSLMSKHIDEYVERVRKIIYERNSYDYIINF